MELVKKVRSVKVISHALGLCDLRLSNGNSLKPHIYSMTQAMFMAVYW